MITEKIKRLLISPKETWKEIAKEETTIKALFYKYAIFLALVPSGALFIGLGVIGFKVQTDIWYRMPVFPALFSSIFFYILNIGGAFANGHIINFIGHYFHSESDLKAAMKLAVYSAAAYWLAGVFVIIPSLRYLAPIAGLYSVYLLYLGCPVLIKTSPEKVLPLIVSVIVASMILVFIFGGIVEGFIFSPINREFMTY